jgi:hypothetical protein
LLWYLNSFRVEKRLSHLYKNILFFLCGSLSCFWVSDKMNMEILYSMNYLPI